MNTTSTGLRSTSWASGSTTFGGPKKLTVTREPLPLEFARGLRRALKAALARVDAEIAEATGGEAEDDAA